MSTVKLKVLSIKHGEILTEGGKPLEGYTIVYVNDAGEEKTKKLFSGFRSYIKLEDELAAMKEGEWWEITVDDNTKYKDWITPATKLDAEPPKRVAEKKQWNGGGSGGGSSWYGSAKHVELERERQASIERQHAITKAVDILISGKKVDLKEVKDIADAINKMHEGHSKPLDTLKNPLDEEDKPFVKE